MCIGNHVNIIEPIGQIALHCGEGDFKTAVADRLPALK
jgi:hypothetical protein